MAAESSFQRRDENGVAVFDVTPARTSLAFMGCLVLCFIVALPALVIFAGLLTINLRGTSGGFFLSGIFICGASYFFWLLYRRNVVSPQYRKQVTLKASSEGLEMRDRFIPRADIAELSVRQGGKSPETSTVVAAGWGVAPGMVMMSQGVGTAIHRRQLERSYVLTLRTKQNSKAEVISGGLTFDCARSLMDDIVKALDAK